MVVKESEQIDWQFVDKYYVLLIQQMDTVRRLVVYDEDYEKAYGELAQIFNTINYSIKAFDMKRYESFILLIDEINGILYQFKTTQIQRGMPKQAKAIKLTKIRHEMKLKINVFHRELMSTMDQMNMMFKRKRVDNREEIYKT